MDNSLKNIVNEVRQNSNRAYTDIDGTEYSVKLLPAKAAWVVTQQLIELVSPVLGCLYDNAESMDFDESNAGTSLGVIISRQLGNMDLTELMDVLLVGSERDGIPLDTNELLGAKGLGIMVELTELSLKENCLDFLIGWLGKKGLKIPSMAELQKVQGQM